MRNVEIKAKINDVEDFINKVSNLTQNTAQTIQQVDTFFNIQNGRLKLRKCEDGNAELIYYDRPNIAGPKLSSFEICNIKPENVESLSRVLAAALGIKGEIKKERHLYMVGQTRVHVDKVKGLGNFMELEVVLKEDQTTEDGELIAKDLMEKLNVNEQDLLENAYIDMLLQ